MNGGQIMIRMILAVAIVISASLVGLSLSARLSRRIKVLKDFQELMARAQTRLRFSGDTLSAAFNDNVFQFTFQEQKSFCEQWSDLVSGFRQLLSKEELEILSRFSDGIGEGDLTSQIARVEQYRVMIADCERSVREDYGTKARLYRTLSFSTGLVIALLLL